MSSHIITIGLRHTAHAHKELPDTAYASLVRVYTQYKYTNSTQNISTKVYSTQYTSTVSVGHFICEMWDVFVLPWQQTNTHIEQRSARHVQMLLPPLPLRLLPHRDMLLLHIFMLALGMFTVRLMFTLSSDAGRLSVPVWYVTKL